MLLQFLAIGCNKEDIEVTEGSILDDRDGSVYKTKKFGDYWWMIENLAYHPKNKPDTKKTFEPAYYVYGYSDSVIINNGEKEFIELPYYHKYGILYNCAAAKESCPVGWHLPADFEWKNLEFFLGMPLTGPVNHLFGRNPSDVLHGEGMRVWGFVGDKLKSSSGWGESDNGDNSSGFNVHPTGFLNDQGNFFGLDSSAYYWTSSEKDAEQNWSRYLISGSGGVGRDPFNLTNGFSVRCIKD